MSEEKTPVYVSIGPFDSKVHAQHFIETLRGLSTAGHVAAARARLVPGRVGAAVDLGLQHLCVTPGHVQIRIDGGPGVDEPVIDYKAGGTFKKPA